MQTIRLVCLFLGSFLIASSAFPEDLGVRSYGLRGGIAANPDQFYVGGHVDAGRLGERVRLQPSFELGFGNGLILGAANFDAHYLFSRRSFRPYAGGGLGLNVFDVSNGRGESDGLNVEPVLNLVGGLEWGAPARGSRAVGRYLLEARVGMGDTPELKIGFGMSF